MARYWVSVIDRRPLRQHPLAHCTFWAQSPAKVPAGAHTLPTLAVFTLQCVSLHSHIRAGRTLPSRNVPADARTLHAPPTNQGSRPQQTSHSHQHENPRRAESPSKVPATARTFDQGLQPPRQSVSAHSHSTPLADHQPPHIVQNHFQCERTLILRPF